MSKLHGFNEYTPGAVFDEFFEDRMWIILSENTNKCVHAKLRQAKDTGDKDPIELLTEGVEQNPCVQLNNLEDTSPDEDEGICSSSYCYGNSQDKFSRTVLE